MAGAIFGSGSATKVGVAICTTPTTTAVNVNTDCEQTGPHNETAIAVNPTNPVHMIAGANDYQLAINPGGHITASVLSRARVTTDGGQTWTTSPLLSSSAYQATGDPSIAFDADGRAYYATLGNRFVGPANTTNPDILVANSADGGRNWSVSVVAAGSGNAGSVGDLGENGGTGSPNGWARKNASAVLRLRYRRTSSPPALWWREPEARHSRATIYNTHCEAGAIRRQEPSGTA